jgi:fatty acyl-CoA reductase
MIGSSGFVGKCVLEKLLRDVPELKRMYVMVRGSKGQTPQERFTNHIAG